MTDEKSGAARQTAIGAFVLGGVALSLAAFVLFGASHLFSSTVASALSKASGLSSMRRPRPRSSPVTIELDPGRVTVTSGNADHKINLSEVIGRGLRAELNTQSFVTGLDGHPACKGIFRA